MSASVLPIADRSARQEYDTELRVRRPRRPGILSYRIEARKTTWTLPRRCATAWWCCGISSRRANMMPILSGEGPAAIRCNIAQFCQEPGV